MLGCDARHDARVAGKAAQMIGRDDLMLPADPQDRRIIARARHHIRPQRPRQLRQRCGQRDRPHLGPAAATHWRVTHGLRHAQCHIAGQCGLGHCGKAGQFVHERPVDAVFHAPHPRALCHQPELFGHGQFAPHRDDLQVIALRAKSTQALARQGRAQIVMQNRGRTHGKDARLGPWRVRQIGAIACGKNGVIAGLQRRPHRNRALDHVQAKVGKPALRCRARHADGEICRNDLPAGQCHIPWPHRHHGIMCDDRDACRMPQHRRPRAWPNTGQGLPFVHHGHLCLHPVPHGHGQLDARHTTAQHHDARVCHLARHKCCPSCCELPQRTRGHHMVHAHRACPHPHIQRCHVIAQGRAVLQLDQPCRAVDANGAVQYQPRARKAAQAHKVDHHIRRRVMPCHQPRQHAGIGRHRPGVNQRQAHTRLRVHAPTPQHQRMRMPTAQQDQITRQGNGLLHLAFAFARLMPRTTGAH